MNEWAAQRHLIQANRSRLIHPPYDAGPVAKFLGYLGRISVLLVLPLVIYVLMLQSHLKSKEFNGMLEAGVVEAFDASEAVTRGAEWRFDGMLNLNVVEATGNPGAFYDRLKAANVSARLPLSKLFRREWLLPRVSVGEMTVSLRSGGLGTIPQFQMKDELELNMSLDLPSLMDAGAPAPEAKPAGGRLPSILDQGLGVGPDFKQLRFNSLQIAELRATWGTGAATAGSVSQMQTDLVRTARGWDITGTGGRFSQGWLSGLTVKRLAIEMGEKAAVVKEAKFEIGIGGTGEFTGQMSLGETPEVEGEMKLENVKLQELVSSGAAGLFTAEGSGSMKWSGSVNRSSGIRMEGTLEIASGRVTAIPVLKALHQLSSQDQFRLLPIKSGRVEFSSQGTGGGGGLVIEVSHLELDFGPLARLRGNYRQEQLTSIDPVTGNRVGDTTKITGLFQLGVSAAVTSNLAPAMVDRFFKTSGDGWWWVDILVDEALSKNLSSRLADAMLTMAGTGPGK